MMETLT
jgi:methylmalonyl-CoA mutase